MLARFWTFARPYRGEFAIGFLLLIGTNALAAAIPWVLREAIGALERGVDRWTLGSFAGVIAVLALVQAWVRTRSRLRILGASRHVVHDLREAFFLQLQRMSARWYDSHRTGDVMSRAVNDLQILQAVYGPGVMNLLNTAIVYTAVLGLLLVIDPLLTVVALALFPLLFWTVNRISKGVYMRSRAAQEQLGAISDRAQENFSGIHQVKIFVQEDREADAFRRLCDEYRRRNLALARQRGLMIAVIGVFAGCGTLLVLSLGGLRVIRGAMTFGDFVAFNAYLAMLAWPTVALGWIVNVVQRGAGAMERIDEVLLAEPEILPGDDDGAPPLDGDLEIRSLAFGHTVGGVDGRAVPILRDVTLSIPRGSRVALVGPVGSGKSTLMNLIAGVYPTPPGTIFIGGVDIASVPIGRLRRSVGYVPQEAFLFSRSLRDNVAFGKPSAGDDEIAQVVRLAHLEADLPDLPGGLDTVVGERGYTLSGGQRQRATIARAALPGSRLLLFDDSLASVDADTERGILEELLGRQWGEATVLLITHRLATLSLMDRIVVIDAGRVVEDGTHEELVAADGFYARLLRRFALTERLDRT